jgi:hypothetical protein
MENYTDSDLRYNTSYFLGSCQWIMKASHLKIQSPPHHYLTSKIKASIH